MIKTLKEVDFRDKRVLIRVDFNVPIDENGEILDDFKIISSLPTINYVLESGARQVVLMSHLDPWKDNPAENRDDKLKMDNIAVRLKSLIGYEVAKVDACVDVVLPDSNIVLLENLRFYPEEKKNNKSFAKKLASFGDVYVNDAFGTCHREHASVSAVVKYFKKYCAGLLVQKEIEILTPVLRNPEHPFYVILGGVKVETRMGVIENLGKIADKIFVGGKMALAFANVGLDLEEREKAQKLMEKYSDKIVLPLSYVTEDTNEVYSDSIPNDKQIFDIGFKTVLEWKNLLKDAKTIVWNGPLGYFEKEPFNIATNEIAKYLANINAKTIIGGGDTANAVRLLDLQDEMTHVSTGGGASLEFLEGKKLPGLKALGFY